MGQKLVTVSREPCLKIYEIFTLQALCSSDSASTRFHDKPELAVLENRPLTTRPKLKRIPTIYLAYITYVCLSSLADVFTCR